MSRSQFEKRRHKLVDEAIICLESCIELCGDKPEAAELKQKAMDNLGAVLNGTPLVHTEREN